MTRSMSTGITAFNGADRSEISNVRRGCWKNADQLRTPEAAVDLLISRLAFVIGWLK